MDILLLPLIFSLLGPYERERPEVDQGGEEEQTAGLSGGGEGPGDAGLESAAVPTAGSPAPGQTGAYEEEPDALPPSAGKEAPPSS